jgi:membrane protein YdbS with pleckstrin-like domain
MSPLPRAARSYWRATLALQAVGAVAAVTLLLGRTDVPRWPVTLLAVLAVAVVVVVPELRWRRWRYAIGDEQLELLHGTLVARRTLVPIRRVQHVASEQGPLQEAFDVETVTFHTAAGAVSIPALHPGEADRVRRRVAELAGTLDDV